MYIERGLVSLQGIAMFPQNLDSTHLFLRFLFVSVGRTFVWLTLQLGRNIAMAAWRGRVVKPAEDRVGIEYSLLFQRCEAMLATAKTFGTANMNIEWI